MHAGYDGDFPSQYFLVSAYEPLAVRPRGRQVAGSAGDSSGSQISGLALPRDVMARERAIDLAHPGEGVFMDKAAFTPQSPQPPADVRQARKEHILLGAPDDRTGDASSIEPLADAQDCAPS